MEYDAPNTKTLLVLAAGELFAAHGFEGVSTRMIADKAGVNLGCIHYHFGTKENLYVEAFKYVCERGRRQMLSDVINENPALADTPEGCAAAIREMCRRFLQDFASPEKPEWRARFVSQELTNPSAALPIMVRDEFRPDHEYTMAFYRRIRPEASEDEAHAWALMLKAQAVFYLMSKAALVLVRDGKPLDEQFFTASADMLARAMIMLAGLPLPEDLR